MSDHHPVERVEGVQGRSAAKEADLKKAAAQKLLHYTVVQEAAKEGFQEWADLDAYNPLALARNFQSLEKRAREKTKPEETAKSDSNEIPEEIEAVEKSQEIAEGYSRKNPELEARTLLSIRARISRNDSPEEILRKLKAVYVDVALVDEALDFLMETADAEMQITLRLAREELYRLSEREVKAGRNIGVQARTFSSQGLGSPTALRDLYRELTANPRDAITLFDELSTHFPLDKMKVVIDFVLHSLGADMKAKGPSISKDELQRMMSETRNMQAILGVYRYFLSRMPLMTSSFEREGLALSPRLSFDFLAKVFVAFLMEKYPSVDKALLLSQKLGISAELLAQLIIYLQYRDATRQVAPRLFRNERHRQEILLCFMEALESIEEKLEEQEDNDPDSNKKKK
jgi:type III secretion protein W